MKRLWKNGLIPSLIMYVIGLSVLYSVMEIIFGIKS